MSPIWRFVICGTPRVTRTCNTFPSIFLIIFPASSQQRLAPLFLIRKTFSIGSHLTMAALTPCQHTAWLLVLLPQNFLLAVGSGFGNSTPSQGWYIFCGWLVIIGFPPSFAFWDGTSLRMISVRYANLNLNPWFTPWGIVPLCNLSGVTWGLFSHKTSSWSQMLKLG